MAEKSQIESDTDATESPANKTVGDRIEGFLAVYLKESMLWPVLIAVLAHVWVALSAVQLMVVRDRNPVALFPAFIAVLGTIGCIRMSRARGYKVIPAIVLSAWVLAAVIAVIANRYDVY